MNIWANQDEGKTRTIEQTREEQLNNKQDEGKTTEMKHKPLLTKRDEGNFFFFFFVESQICVFYECSISGAYESLHFLI